MQRYIGTKIIKAEPMNRQKYNDFRGWQLPENEDGMDEGYLVEYLDGGKPNTDTHEGYVSWSPKEQFDKAYKECNALTFGLALDALKEGLRIARAGWNGKGMWLTLIPAGGDLRLGEGQFPILPWIGMKTADDKFVPWLASQTDVLASDWVVVE